jgi:hypothetical protein
MQEILVPTWLKSVLSFEKRIYFSRGIDAGNLRQERKTWEVILPAVLEAG